MRMKRITSLLMALVLLVGVVSLCAPKVSAAGSSFKTSAECVALIKEYEGFCKYPIWDYGQYSVGYGTRCPDDMLEYYQTYGITEEEAEVLLRNFLVSFEKDVNQGLIDKYQLTLNQNQFDALISFSYNCGSGWIYNSGSSVFKDAILNGATGNDLIRAFALWCSAGGEVLTYLLTRRLAEANMYLNGVYSRTPPAHYCYVLYEANGGTTSPRTQGYSTEWAVVPFPVPTYEGYTFDGWYTEPNGGTKVTSLTAEHKGKTLYAHWLDAEGNVPDNSIEPVTITVTGSDVNIRKGPGTNYASIGKAQKGDQMVITETAEGTGYTWGKFDGGWICLQYTNFDEASKNPGGTDTPNEPEDEDDPTEPPATEPEEEEVILTGTVNVREFLRIRSGPGTNYDLVDYLGPNDRVEIYETKTVGAVVWGRISNGWISLDYVILDEKVEEPEQEPEEPSEPTEPSAPTEPEVPTEPEKPTEPSEPSQPTEPSEPTEPEEPSKPSEPASDVWTGQIVNCTKLRIRTGPGTNYDIAGYLDVNTIVTMTEIRNGSTMKWGKIAEGWIGLDYVKILSTPQDAPEQETPNEVLTGTINVKEWLRIRVGPGTSYAIAGYLHPNDRVTITEVRNVNGTKWGKIPEGWISLDYVILDEKESGKEETPTEPTKPSEPTEPTEPEQPKVMTVIADCLNVRSAPGTSNSIVGYLYEGAKVTILEETMLNGTKWGRISNGWICMDYVV